MSTPSRDNLTRDEAVRRHEQVAGVAYRLDLDLEEGAKGFRGDVTIAFPPRGGGHPPRRAGRLDGRVPVAPHGARSAYLRQGEALISRAAGAVLPHPRRI